MLLKFIAMMLCLIVLPTEAEDLSSSAQHTAPLSQGNLAVVDMTKDELAARHLTRIEMGKLELPTGHIVATDPLTHPDIPALSRTVAPNIYPVVLYSAPSGIALMELRIAAGNVSRWEIATLPKKTKANPANDSFSYEDNVYEVSAGLGCFMDKAAASSLKQRHAYEQKNNPLYEDDYFGIVLLPELERHDDRYTLHHPIPKQPGIAIVQIPDNAYISYWGLDKHGKALVLVTDFNLLRNAQPY